jgi:RNA polymerase sigma factor (sigma-70 family)
MDYNKLVKDTLKFKPQAQQELYKHFAQQMLGICFRYTKSIADAEDVLQEGFLKVFRHLDQYDFEGELGAWIRKVMVNTALNYLKKNKRYQNDLLYEELPLHPVSTDDPHVNLEVKELAELIRQLPTGFQTIFNLHAIEGYSHVEIAAMLGITDGTSRSQYARGRALLIQWLKKRSIELKPRNYERK